MIIDQVAVRRRAVGFFLLAFVAGVCGFVALFVGKMDFFVSLGVAILCFGAFVLAVKRAFHLWDDAGKPELQKHE